MADRIGSEPAGTTAYCGDNCNHTGPHSYPPQETQASLRDRMERETAEAAFILAGVMEARRFRGRLTKVTVNDVAALLGAARNLRTDALLDAARDVLAESRDG